MEDVRGGRVVDNDGLAERAADLTQILDVVSLVIVARFAEQTVVYRVGDVELVQERVAIFGYGGGEHNNFVDLADTLEEGVDSWAFDDVDIVVLAFNLHGNCEVCLVEDLNEC